MAADFDNRSPNSVENSNKKKSILSTIGGWTGSLPWNGLVFFVIAMIGCKGGNEMAKKSFNQGVENSKLQQYDKAITDYNKAIELDPKYAMAYNNRGFAYGKLQQHDRAITDKAITDCTKAIELDPKLASAYSTRGNAYLYHEQHDKAMTDCNKAIELDPK